MDTQEETIQRLAKDISERQIKLFSDLLRNNLKSAGVEDSIVDHALSTACAQMEQGRTSQIIADEVVRLEENRGVDSVGRVLVEYCFFRGGETQLLWPEDSEQDTQARRRYVPGVIPRPLMRYFLISVRGTIHSLDGFEADSILFDNEQERYEQLKQKIADLLEQFKGPFGSGESAIDWKDVYEDSRFQIFALDIIRELRGRIEQDGMNAYLERLEHYRSHDPERERANIMHRPLSDKDADQLVSALASAEAFLSGEV